MTAPRLRPTPHTRWLDAESADLVREFWAVAGGEEPFPRNLERSLALALPVTLVRVPRLQLRHAAAWLHERGVRFPLEDEAGGARAVHGCILARAGYGFLFVDGSDNDADLRFTIAHEIGHFLAEHQLPRRRAIARFGAGIVDVLDGRRPPTNGERLAGNLAGMSFLSTHSFLPRAESAEGGLELWRVEGAADRIGAALLAPPAIVLAAAAGSVWEQRLDNAHAALIGRFGLPPTPALHYARTLLAENGLGPSWSESMRHALRT